MNPGDVQTIETAAGVSPIPVPSATSVNTPAFRLDFADAFGVEFLAVCDGTPNIKVELEESMDGTNFVEPDGLEDIAVIGDELRHIRQITPVPAKYGRFKLTGQGANPADTTLQIKLFRQEQV